MQLVEFRQCTNTAFEGKMQLLRFPVLQGSAEEQVIWCGIVKCLLIAYFIGNMSAKKISKSAHVSKLWQVKNLGRFFETRCIVIWNLASLFGIQCITQNKHKQVAQLSQRDRATHELLRFAKLWSGFFDLPFWGLRGNMDASCVRRRKKRGRLPIGDNWTF